MIFAFFWRSEPAAALRGFLKGAAPCSSCSAHSFWNAPCGIYTSPRTSRNSGASFNFLGMLRMARTLAVTSSPTTPSPRVEARTSSPFSYSRLQERPSILISTTYSGSMPASRTRRSKSRSSSYENASSRLSIFTAWVTLGSLLLAVPPTFWVGDDAVTSCGNCASNSFSSRVRASYSKSSSSGASWS